MKSFRRPLAIAFLLLSLPFAASAGEGDEAVSPVSCEVSAVSDYLFRGASQTNEKATLQGTLTWTSPVGLYVGGFASGVDFGEDSPEVEVDYFVGYGFDVTDSVNIDLLLNRYTYPGASEMAYNELVTTTTIAEDWAVNVSYTNDVWGSGTTGWYYGLSHELALPNDVTLSASVGRSVFRDSAVAEDYTDWGVGISRSFGPANVSLGYYGVDGKGRDNFGQLADSRVLLSVKFAR